MDYKREMIDKLRNYQSRRASLEFTAKELERLDAEMTRIQSSMKDTAPVSGGENHTEDRLVNLIMKKMEIESIRRETEAWVLNLERALAALDEDERHIITVMCIESVRGAVEQLCNEFGEVDERTIYRKRNRALRHLTILYYGAIER